MKRLPLGLLLAIAVYVGMRAYALLFAFDQVGLTNYELYPMGTLPKAILVGAEIPLRVYYDNAAGQLVTGIAALPFYVLFGDGWMSLKMVPAFCGLGALLCVWLLVDGHFTRRAANLAALAFALGPAELVSKYSLMASGNHFENLFFISLALLCFYRLHRVEQERYGRWLILTGFATGFALFVFLGAVIPAGLMLGMHLGLRGWRATGADLKLGLPALVLGIAPLILVNLSSGGRGLDFLDAKFGEDQNQARDWGLVADRMHDFLLVELPRAGVHYSFEDGQKAAERWDEMQHPFVPVGGWPNDRSPHLPWINFVLIGAFLVAWGAALPSAVRGCWRIARSLTGGEGAAFADLLMVPFVLLPPLATLAYGLSNLKVDQWPQRLAVAGYRYYLPIFLVCTILVAIVADRWLRAKRAGLVGGVLLLAGMFSASVWNLAWLRLGTPGVGQHYLGYNFVQSARGLFNSSIGLSHEDRVEIAETVPGVFRTHLYRGIGLTESSIWVAETSQDEGVRDREGLFQLLRSRPCPVDRIVSRFPEHARPEVARGVGAGLRNYVGMQGQEDAQLQVVVAALQLVVQSDSAWAPFVLEGAAMMKDFPDPWSEIPRLLPRSKRLLELLPEDQRASFGLGLGEVCGRLYAREIPEEEEFLKNFVYGCLGLGGMDVLVGLGRGLALADDRPEITDAVREAIPDTVWEKVAAGFAAGLAEVQAIPE